MNLHTIERKNGIHDLHRLDGPAVVYTNGTKIYAIFGEILTEKKFYKHPLVKAISKLDINEQKSVGAILKI